MANEMIFGLKAFEKKLDALADPRLARKVLRAAVTAGMTPVLKSARQKIPRGTKPHRLYNGQWVSPGYASRSVRKTAAKIEGQSIVSTVGVTGGAFYALFFETGASRGKPHSHDTPKRPWLIPALKENEDLAIGAFNAAMFKWLKKVANKK